MEEFLFGVCIGIVFGWFTYWLLFSHTHQIVSSSRTMTIIFKRLEEEAGRKGFVYLSNIHQLIEKSMRGLIRFEDDGFHFEDVTILNHDLTKAHHKTYGGFLSFILHQIGLK